MIEVVLRTLVRLLILCSLVAGTLGLEVGIGMSPAFASSSYTTAVLSNSPVAYWPMNETSGSTFADDSGNGYTGTVGSGVTLGNSPGPITLSSNNEFPASSSGNPMSTSSAPQTNATAWTDEIWFKTSQTSNAVMLSDRNMSGGGSGMSLSLEIGGSPISGSAGSVGFGLDSNAIWIGVQTTTAYNDNKWHYAVGVWSASSGTSIATSQFSIYIDGALAATTAHSTGSATSPLSGSGGETIGAQNNGALLFYGDLSRAAIYNSALSASSISTHYKDAGTIIQASPTTGLQTSGKSFSDQLNVTGNSGAVTFAVTTPSPAFSVSSSGAVSSTSALATGTYVVSGTDSDTSGNQGSWSYTLTVAAAGSQYKTAVLNSTPEAYWPLNDASGSSTFVDDSGNGYTGTVGSGVSLGNSPGPIISSSNNLYPVASGTGPLSTSSAPQSNAVAWTDEIWFKTTSTSNAVLLSDRGEASGGGGLSLSLEIGGSPISAQAGSVGFGVDSNNIWVGVQTNSTYNDGSWHYAVGVWSAPSGTAISTSQFSIYIDGSAVATSAHSTGSATSPLSGLGGETIGSQDGSPYQLPFSGDLARAAIYGSSLSASRILTHYEAGAGKIVQSAPTTGSTTVGTNYANQLNVTGNSGTVTYSVTTPSPAFSVSSTGAVSEPGTLSSGTYTVSGTDSDTSSNSGSWTFTLTVGQAPTITSASSTTFTAGLTNSFSVTTAAGTYPGATISNSAFTGCTPSTLPSGLSISPSGTLTSTTSLIATGSYTLCLQASNGIGSPGTQTFTLTVQFDNTGFASPAQQNESGDFFGVAYTGSNIIAVGDDNTATYGEISYETGDTGSDWNVIDDLNSTSPTSSDGAGIQTGALYGVACPTSSVCVAVGQNSARSAGEILYTTSTPTSSNSWLSASVPAGVTELYSISCGSASSCIAVGQAGGSGAIVSTTNGGATWTTNSSGIDTLPTNLGTITGLFGVSCVSSSDCNAVGEGNNSGSLDGAFLYYNGSSWTTQAYTSSGGELSGISCVSASVCYASGYGGGAAQVYSTSSANSATGGWTLSSSWAGSAEFLYSVDCLSSTVCYAVGWHGGSGLIEVTSNGGSTWSPISISDGEIAWYAITCPSSSSLACTVVGSNAASPFYPVAAYGD